MADNIYSIGSVIQANNCKCLVIGIIFNEENGIYKREYLVVPYPFGYLNADSLRLIDSKDAQLLFEGYKNDQTGCLLEFMNNVDDLSKLADVKTIESLSNSVNKRLKEA